VERRAAAGFIDGDEPPFLVMHGVEDAMVAPADSLQLAGRVQRARGRVELQMVPGVGHVAMINGFRSPKHSPALGQTLRYIGLGAEAPPPAFAAGTAGGRAPGASSR
jgi:acetyl esterase/lipase